MTRHGNLQIRLVQQGVWSQETESMPLASAYIKSVLDADPLIKEQCNVVIKNFSGAATAQSILRELLTADGQPDVVGFSVQGWNYHTFGRVSDTLKQIAPGTVIVFGGPHAAHQASKIFRQYPSVDIIVNGEGEFTFLDIVTNRLTSTWPDSLHHVPGISFHEAQHVVHNQPRDLIGNLDDIPSPILSGALDLTDATKRFRYDVAIMETNRGCPYKCSFCYWGGAVGQRVRAFSRQRLRAELEVLAQLSVETVVLCDANFGMLRSDVDFVTDLIALKSRYGYPRALETSWAKNKSATFKSIVTMMHAAGLHSSFTIALQTLTENALGLMNRRNMKLNDWEDLVDWLESLGLNCYGELIFGVPGESADQFLASYDRLSRRISRIAVYPLLVMPNTDYYQRRSDYGLVTYRGKSDDFEYVLASGSLPIDEAADLASFVLWARLLGEHSILRHFWAPLRELAGIGQSRVIKSIQEWAAAQRDGLAARLNSLAEQHDAPVALSDALVLFYEGGQGRLMLEHWWREQSGGLIDDKYRDFLGEVLRFDLETLPLYSTSDVDTVPGTEPASRTYRQLRFRFDMRRLRAPAGGSASWLEALEPISTLLTIEYRLGFRTFMFNHEEGLMYFGRVAELCEVPSQ